MKLSPTLHHSVSPTIPSGPGRCVRRHLLDAFVFILVLSSQPSGSWDLCSSLAVSSTGAGASSTSQPFPHTPSLPWVQPHWLSLGSSDVPRSHPPPYPGGLQPSALLAGKSISFSPRFSPNHFQILAPMLLPQETFHGLLGWFRCLVYYNSHIYMYCSFMALTSVVILYLFL